MTLQLSVVGRKVLVNTADYPLAIDGGNTRMWFIERFSSTGRLTCSSKFRSICWISHINVCFEFEFAWSLCCLMTHGLSEYIRCHVWSYSFPSLQITRSDIRPHVNRTVSLVITDGHVMLLRGWCGYVWANILSLLPLMVHSLRQREHRLYIYIYIYIYI